MKFFNRREALAHGNRVCVGIFPDVRAGSVAFVRIEEDPDGPAEFSVDHWVYGDDKPGEWSDTEKFVRDALAYVRSCGAKSVVLMYDPYSGEGLVQRLLDDPEWSGFIEQSVQLAMTRKHMARAHEVVAQALTENRVTKFDGQDHGIALAVEAAIKPIETPARWVRWAKRATPYALLLLAAAVNAWTTPPNESLFNAVATLALIFWCGQLSGMAIERGWTR